MHDRIACAASAILARYYREAGVSSVEEGIRWVNARIGEIVDNATIDGIQIRRKDGPRSWPVHAYVRFVDVDTTTEAVQRELAACVEEATESGSSLHLRLVTMRAGTVASSRAIFVAAPEASDSPGGEEDRPSGGAVSAVVATNRDLRGLLEVFARQQGAAVSQAMQGWAGAMQRAAELERDNAELRASLVVAEQSQQADPLVQQALMSLAPQIPMLLQGLASKTTQGGAG